MAQGIVESQGSSESESSSQGGSAGSRSKLVQRLLDAGPNLPAFINDLLTTQAVTVAGTEAAGFLIERSENAFSLRPIAHIRPDEASPETRAAAIHAFQEIIRPCVTQNKHGAIEIGGNDGVNEPQFCLVTLLRNEGEIVAASAVITRCMNLERAKQRLMSMELVAGYFELYSLKRNVDQSRVIAQSHQHVLQLATAVATAEGFESAAMNLCNELASRSHAVRVSLGWVKGNNIKVKALSHTEQFDKKQELVVHLQRTMEECRDQENIVQFDPGGDSSDNVTRAAAELSRTQGGHIVLSLPLRKREETVGVITLEFLPSQKLGPNVASGLAVAVDLLAPQLSDRYDNDRWLITKMGLSIKHGAAMVIGPKHMLGKLITSVILAAVLAVCLIKPMYHVSAPFQFVPIEKRSLCAPYDGFIRDVKFDPGEKVKAGDVLMVMDTTELQKKLAQTQADARKYEKEAEKNRAESKIAEQQMALAQRDASLANAALLEYQISKGELVAPGDGVILKGDLKHKRGSSVRQGDVLMEVAPSGQLRAEIAVPERDIQDVHIGQQGKLATASLPSDTYPFTIQRIVPEGKPQEGENIFIVYATMDQTSDSWLAGLGGEANIDVAHKPMIWIWSHRLVNLIKLKTWTWF